jgi:phosphoribosylformylglycinamidine synthase subunit PurL
MWQLSEAVDGLSDACLALEVPVTGGNVSLYNQTGTTAIHPTPVVGVLGVIDDVAKRVPSGWQDDGLNLYLLGTTALELDGSAWAGVVHGHLGGRPPAARLEAERDLAGLLAAAAEEGLVSAAHDLGEGGLAQTLAEAVLRFGVGARVWLGDVEERDGVDTATALFSESTARVLVAVPREEDVKFVGLCAGRRVPALRIGVTDGESGVLEVQDRFTLPVEELRTAHEGTLPARLGPRVAETAILAGP